MYWMNNSSRFMLLSQRICVFWRQIDRQQAISYSAGDLNVIRIASVEEKRRSDRLKQFNSTYTEWVIEKTTTTTTIFGKSRLNCEFSMMADRNQQTIFLLLLDFFFSRFFLVSWLFPVSTTWMSTRMRVVCYCRFSSFPQRKGEREREGDRKKRRRKTIGTNVYPTTWAKRVIVIEERTREETKRNRLVVTAANMSLLGSNARFSPLPLHTVPETIIPLSKAKNVCI